MRLPLRNKYLRGRLGISGLTYALAVGLIAVVIIGALTLMGGGVNSVFSNASNRINGGGSNSGSAPTNPAPVWTTAAGSLGNLTKNVAMTPIILVATDNGSISGYAVTSGALPAGVTLAGNGTISGTPTVAGTFNFTATATDNQGSGTPRTFSLSVGDPPPVWVTGPGSLGSLTMDSAITPIAVQASDDSSIASYTITGGALPGGLTLSSGGVISGTPNAAGFFTFTITVTDDAGGTTPQDFTLTITDPPPVWVTASGTLGNRSIAVAMATITLQATDNGSVSSYTIASGALPTGVSLSSGGIISGTPTTGGTFTFTVNATDNAGGSTARSFSLGITGPLTLGTTGSDQSFIVPAGVSTISVKLWGGGGGGSRSAYGRGGGGAFINANMTVTPGETLTVIVGGGGAINAGGAGNGTASYGGGGVGASNTSSGYVMYVGSGGGRSAIRRGGTELVTAAGGGGGADYYKCGGSISATHPDGGAGGIASGADGTLGGGVDRAGKAGTASAGGAGGASGGNPGSQYTGGNGNGFGGAGGGGGWYGGGGSGAFDCSGGAGGGSSYYGGVSLVSSAAGSGTTPGGTGDANYAASAGTGGDGGAGNPGRVVINWTNP